MRLQPTRLARVAAISALAMGLVTGGLAQDRNRPDLASTPDCPRLYIFFTPQDSLKLDARRLKDLSSSGVRLIPQLLAGSLEAAGNDWGDRPEFVESLKLLESVLGEGRLDLSIHNTEGLTIAQSLSIRRTPACVYQHDLSHAHMAYGNQVDLKELVSCKR